MSRLPFGHSKCGTPLLLPSPANWPYRLVDKPSRSGLLPVYSSGFRLHQTTTYAATKTEEAPRQTALIELELFLFLSSFYSWLFRSFSLSSLSRESAMVVIHQHNTELRRAQWHERSWARVTLVTRGSRSSFLLIDGGRVKRMRYGSKHERVSLTTSVWTASIDSLTFPEDTAQPIRLNRYGSTFPKIRLNRSQELCPQRLLAAAAAVVSCDPSLRWVTEL